MGMKPSAPVGLDTSVMDQASRYGLSVDDYLYGSENTYTAGSELPSSFEKGNPFFTGTNQPTMAKTQSKSIQRPFIWQGNNKSLRKVYQNSYNSYWNDSAKPNNFEQQATWQGPQIRPEYQGVSNGLSQLGTPSYWQDNNKNQLFDSTFDDSFGASQSLPMDMSQVASMTTPMASQNSSSNPDDEFGNLLDEYAAQALQSTMYG